jgi:starch synthase
VAPYSSEDLSGKALNKQALQERMGLAATPGMPLVGMVSRMTWQKGIDLVLDTMGRLLDQPLQVAVLGNADDEYGHHCERRWRQLAGAFPGRVAAEFRYDEALSHLLEAGADMFLMPSRFEPCGLNQMYSMAYGTLPLVRHTGGLADSVVDTTPRTLSNGTATGFVFHLGSEGELLACALRALCLYRDQNAWRMVQTNGMRKDFSWRASAAQYLEIYRRLAG